MMRYYKSDKFWGFSESKNSARREHTQIILGGHSENTKRIFTEMTLTSLAERTHVP